MEGVIITTDRCVNRCVMRNIWKYPTKIEKAIDVLLVLLAFSAPLFARSPNVNKYLLIRLVVAWFVRDDG